MNAAPRLYEDGAEVPGQHVLLPQMGCDRRIRTLSTFTDSWLQRIIKIEGCGEGRELSVSGIWGGGLLPGEVQGESPSEVPPVPEDGSLSVIRVSPKM